MTTVTIPSVEVKLTVDQLIDAFKRLPPEEQQKVREELELSSQDKIRAVMDRVAARYEANPLSDEDIESEINTARQEMRQLLAESRKRFAQDPMTEEEINAEVDTVKQDFYAQRSH